MSRGGTRFGFYGRVSTEDQQDPEASRAWQLSRARALVQPAGGQVVAEFFDVAHSRSLPWRRRPQAAQLLEALKDPARGFEAVVIGEPQRAFYGNQFGNTFPLFVHYRVPLWVPEVGGAIDPDNEAHDLIMSVFGGMSKGERNRIRVRVRAAMAAQTQMEGRFLGGRPPYGYRLRDLGPHPNPAKAAEGRRLHGLEPDSDTMDVVRRIYAMFLAGHGLYAIAETLTGEGIACPSAHDPDRNRHRSGIAWSKSAVRVILTNPRYTGRQVWNKQRTDETLLDIDDVTLGYTTTQRWNPTRKWITSERLAHPPLIDDATFTAARDLLAARGRGPGEHKRHRTRRPYVLRGVVICGVCERRMQGQWSNERPYYRCRFPEEYALANRIAHPRNVYLREDWLTEPLDAWLAQAFAPHRLNDTLDTMAATDHDETMDAAVRVAQRTIRECDIKLARYRAALDTGADPAVVTAWIAQTQAERVKAEADLRNSSGRSRMSRDEIACMVAALGDLVGVLRQADPADKAEIYRQLGIRLTYHPSKREVRAEAHLDPHHGEMVRVRGGT